VLKCVYLCALFIIMITKTNNSKIAQNLLILSLSVLFLFTITYKYGLDTFEEKSVKSSKDYFNYDLVDTDVSDLQESISEKTEEFEEELSFHGNILFHQNLKSFVVFSNKHAHFLSSFLNNDHHYLYDLFCCWKYDL